LVAFSSCNKRIVHVEEDKPISFAVCWLFQSSIPVHIERDMFGCLRYIRLCFIATYSKRADATIAVVAMATPTKLPLPPELPIALERQGSLHAAQGRGRTSTHFDVSNLPHIICITKQTGRHAFMDRK
jgi:hypothetical protein